MSHKKTVHHIDVRAPGALQRAVFLMVMAEPEVTATMHLWGNKAQVAGFEACLHQEIERLQARGLFPGGPAS